MDPGLRVLNDPIPGEKNTIVLRISLNSETVTTDFNTDKDKLIFQKEKGQREKTSYSRITLFNQEFKFQKEVRDL